MLGFGFSGVKWISEVFELLLSKVVRDGKSAVS